MEYHIPDLLLTIPSPLALAEAPTREGKLNLAPGQPPLLLKQYQEEVAAHIRGTTPDFVTEIVPCVEFALRLFNAENFSGELNPTERNQFQVLFDRFGPVVQHGLFEDDEAAEQWAKKVPKNEEEEEAKRVALKKEKERLEDLCLQRLLTSDGEMVSSCMRLPGLLLCILALVSMESEPGVSLFPKTSLWRLRTFFRHQLCLSRRSHTLFLAVADCIDAMLALPEEELTVEMLIEIGQIQAYYYRRELAAETFHRAMEKSGLVLEETAMMGVRTRWQQHQLVQRVLNASSSRPVPPSSMQEEQPRAIMREKDGHDLLDRPRELADAAPDSLTALHPEDKAILLALCMDIRNTNPYHGLTRHHMMIYVERLLADPAASPFLIQCQTLLMRSRLEAGRNRVQERSFMQITELVDQFSAVRNPTQPMFPRTEGDYFYSVAFPSQWGLRREYADLCFDETLYKTALDIYENILDWEKIMECCKKLDKRRRAESLARDLLKKDPVNPMLWVALGEATHEDEYLWKAWELSEHKMAAPMRALARLALDREHYDKVVEYFDEAVRINPVFGGDWFALGYASLRTQKFERSGEAFTRVCQMDPGDSFAWNNLASIMMREKKLRPAFNAMSQALRNNRRDWRMWQNYFQIGCQLKEVTETTNALNIALDIAKRTIRLDRPTLQLFVENTIAYLRGEIAGSTAEGEEADAAKLDALRYRSLGCLPTAEEVPHAPIGAAVARLRGDQDAEDGADGEEEEEVAGDLAPFGAEVEYDDNALANRNRDGTARGIQPNVELQEGILRRHGERVRALFLRIMDTFVTDPDIYACASIFFRFLDGPLAAYYYRQKELRACQQKDQWDRDESLFRRTVVCLQDSVADLEAAFQLAQDGEAAGAVVVAQRTSQPEGNEEQEEAERESSPPGAADVAGSATSISVSTLRGEELHKAIIDNLKDVQTNVKGALEAAEEHMEESAIYGELRALAGRVRADLQEAKAAFV